MHASYFTVLFLMLFTTKDIISLAPTATGICNLFFRVQNIWEQYAQNRNKEKRSNDYETKTIVLKDRKEVQIIESFFSLVQKLLLLLLFCSPGCPQTPYLPPSASSCWNNSHAAPWVAQTFSLINFQFFLLGTNSFGHFQTNFITVLAGASSLNYT